MRQKRTIVQFLAAATLLVVGGQVFAEVSEVNIPLSFTISNLPLMVMRDKHFLKKYAAAKGVNIKVGYPRLANGAAKNTAYLAGDVQIVPVGSGALIIMWAKTKGTRQEAKGLSALANMPLYLNTRNPNVKTVRDFTSKDRIQVAAVKVSMEAITLQMAVAKVYGIKNYTKLDPLTVSMPEPSGMLAMLSGSEINSAFSAPPYSFWELEDPRIHTVLDSYDVLGGPSSFYVVYAGSKFVAENPKIIAAFFMALKEANALIKKNPTWAAELYLRVNNDRKHTVADMLKTIDNPEVKFSLVPKNVMKYADFMHTIGAIKVKPKSWKDLFFPVAHSLPGS